MRSSLKRPLAFVIFDGWGIGPECERNAFSLAHTPKLGAIVEAFGKCELSAAGEDVGLLVNEPGRADAGHLTIGAGRIIQSPAARLAAALQNGDLFANKPIINAMTDARSAGKAVHLVGLLSDGGIHSSMETVFALLRMAKSLDVKDVFLHPILDGHDVPPRTADVYLEALEIKMHEIGIGRIATLCGRHFAMDSGENWGRTARAFTMLVHSEGERTFDAVAAVRSSFLRGITDEFIAPIVVESQPDVPVAAIAEGDAIILFNHQAEGVRQLALTLAGPNANGEAAKYRIVSLTEYDPLAGIPAAFERDDAMGGLGVTLAAKQIRNVRIAEEERFQHVTASIGNSGQSDEQIQSNFKIVRYRSSVHQSEPEMGSFKVADKFISALEMDPETLLIANFSAADLMAATGDLEKSVEAIQFVDTCLGGIWDAVRQRRGAMIISSSHGNFESVNAAPKTAGDGSGTTNRVPFIIADGERGRRKMRYEGTLADIAPTILHILGIEPTTSMTGRSLLID